ncbi:MAG: SWIM zinc finger family protein, partial [Clostridium sp.]|nr:SWIM zinc finger family protein [Clostridium sp.]
MIKQILIESFNKNVTSATRIKGNRVLKNDLIKEINIDCDDDSININSTVVSESLLSEYNCKLEFDSVTKELIGTHCSCLDFEKNEFKKDNYCCKHIAASFFEFLNRIDNDPELRKKLTNSVEDNVGPVKKHSSGDSHGDNLLNSLLEEQDKDTLKFEITFNKNNWSSKIQAEFKIGLKSRPGKMYMMRDINTFLLSMYNKVPIKYGKDFTFDIRHQKLSFEDK